ncbi:MAG: hypothetical protein RSG92_28055 [Pseudomonas sp.]
MTANKHTPQEWLRGGTTVYALNVEGTNRFSAQVQSGWSTSGRNRTESGELEANARLIAAAPELLEALADCTTMLARIKTHCRITDNAGYSEDGRMLKLTDVENNARAAIAKATGGAA